MQVIYAAKCAYLVGALELVLRTYLIQVQFSLTEVHATHRSFSNCTLPNRAQTW